MRRCINKAYNLIYPHIDTIFLVLLINVFCESVYKDWPSWYKVIIDLIVGIYVIGGNYKAPKLSMISIVACIISYFISYYESISIFYVCIVIIDILRRWLNNSIQSYISRSYNVSGKDYFNQVIENRRDYISVISELFILSGLVCMDAYKFLNSKFLVIHNFLKMFSYDQSLISSSYIILLMGMLINIITICLTKIVIYIHRQLSYVNGIDIVNNIVNSIRDYLNML